MKSKDCFANLSKAKVDFSFSLYNINFQIVLGIILYVCHWILFLLEKSIDKRWTSDFVWTFMISNTIRSVNQAGPGLGHAQPRLFVIFLLLNYKLIKALYLRENMLKKTPVNAVLFFLCYIYTAQSYGYEGMTMYISNVVWQDLESPKPKNKAQSWETKDFLKKYKKIILKYECQYW